MSNIGKSAAFMHTFYFTFLLIQQWFFHIYIPTGQYTVPVVKCKLEIIIFFFLFFFNNVFNTFSSLLHLLQMTHSVIPDEEQLFGMINSPMCTAED